MRAVAQARVGASGSTAETKPPPSIRTSSVAVPSLSEKPNVTLLPVVEAAAGPESIVGAGGATASTVHVRVADALVFP